MDKSLQNFNQVTEARIITNMAYDATPVAIKMPTSYFFEPLSQKTRFWNSKILKNFTKVIVDLYTT